MAGERETASQMFVRHFGERQQFFIDQVKRLNDAGFDWAVPEDFAARQNYSGLGFIVRDKSGEEGSRDRLSRVLTPEGDLILVLPDGHRLLLDPSLDKPLSLFTETEEQVNKTLAGLHAARVS